MTVYKSRLFSNLKFGNEFKYSGENKFEYEWGSEWAILSFNNDSINYHYRRLGRYWSQFKGKRLKNNTK